MSEYLKHFGIVPESAGDRQGGNDNKKTESANYAELSFRLHRYGLETAWLRNDWDGADFVAFHPDPAKRFMLWIQLKGRITIERKYEAKGNLCIAFPHNGEWYVVPHRELLSIVPQSWLESSSWVEKGWYSSDAPSKDTISKLSPYKI